MTAESDRLARTLEAIDQANSADPNQETVDGEQLPRELAYSRHMTRWLHRLEPHPSEEVQIACRAQHIERWTISRDDYPEGRKGYYQWRQACGRFHAERASQIMAAQGYEPARCEHVANILTKRHLKTDPDTQLMEDVACLVFLERYFAPFYREKTDYDRDKWLRIVQRTWQKMSPRGHEAALSLAAHLPEELQTLLQEALSEN
ncbi:DUF4202 domain-containing protein [Marinobacteraceae bacterium S3BR75-40.1]